MARGIRWTLGAIVSLCFIGLIVWLNRSSPESSPNTTRVGGARALSNQDCAECHQRAWQEWSDSAHARSWTSDQVQAAFQHFGHDRKCESCHAPQPVVQVMSSESVQLRAANRDSGVDCLTCHALPDNRVAANRSIDEAPCRPLAVARLSTSQMCGTCHTAIFDDWQGSRYEKAGKSCVSCHMSADDDQATTSHACPGSSNEGLIRSASKMNSRLDGDQLVIEVTNHATGHNFPGERHHRVLAIEVVMHDKDGNIALTQREVIKDITPFRGESSSEQIPIDGTFRAEFPAVPEAVRAEVQLLYKRFPWQPDWKAMVVHQQQLDLLEKP